MAIDKNAALLTTLEQVLLDALEGRLILQNLQIQENSTNILPDKERTEATGVYHYKRYSSLPKAKGTLTLEYIRL